jgi:AcrR family transcriptional regulator
MEEKKLEIIEGASSVYMKYGLKSVTMDDLSRELGISKKTVYKYFKDKTDIVNSIIQFKLEMDTALCLNCQQNSENAIDDLINVSRQVIENIGKINPAVFYDLKRYYPDAWQIMQDHKWGFVLNMTRENIARGKEENIYREDLDNEVIARIYVGITDIILNGEIFPWPEFKFENVFREFINFQIRGMANEKGIKYLQKRFSNEMD